VVQRRTQITFLALSSMAAATACGLATQGTYVRVNGGPDGFGEDATASSSGGSSSGYGSSSGSSSGSFVFGDDGGLVLTDDAGDDGGGGTLPEASLGPCNYDGVWATRISIPVSWSPQGLNSIILAPGTGKIEQWIRGSRTHQGSTLTDATVVCGVSLPDFKSTMLALNETYGVRFPPSLFDNHYLPVFQVTGTISGDSAGATYSTTPTAALLGVTMSSATSDSWPSDPTTLSAVDMDKDGKPGVTVLVASGVTSGGYYAQIPVELPAIGAPLTSVARADKLYLAIRQVTSVSGTVKDCDHISGTVNIPTINGKTAIDSHVLGCELADGGDCSTTASFGSTSQAGFVDNTQPVFTPTGTGTFDSVRIPSGTTCASVRSMLP
jgi:hypothetical protein